MIKDAMFLCGLNCITDSILCNYFVLRNPEFLQNFNIQYDLETT